MCFKADIEAPAVGFEDKFGFSDLVILSIVLTPYYYLLHFLKLIPIRNDAIFIIAVISFAFIHNFLGMEQG